jgi:hypothetical protein
VGLECGPLSPNTEEILERKCSSSGIESQEYGLKRSVTLTTRHPLSTKLALTSLTSGGFSVGIVHSRTQPTDLYNINKFTSHSMLIMKSKKDILYTEVYCKYEVNLRPTVSRPVCPGVRRPSGTCDQFFFCREISCRQPRLYFVAPSLTRGRVCNLLLNCFCALPEQSLLEIEHVEYKTSEKV